MSEQKTDVARQPAGLTVVGGFLWASSGAELIQLNLTDFTEIARYTNADGIIRGLVQSGNLIYVSTLTTISSFEPSTGVFSPFAGQGTGFADGPVDTALFYGAGGMYPTGASLLVIDEFNNRLRELSP